MRLIALVLFFAISFQFGVNGQSSNFGPTFNFSSGKVNTGDEICVQVTTKDFTNLFEVFLPIRWDKEVLEFVEIGNNFSDKISDLDINDFDLSKTDSGYLVLNWKFQECGSATSSVTIDASIEENEVLFEICFKMIGGYGSFSIVEVDDFDNDCKNCPFVKRFFDPGNSSSNCQPILLDENPGLISNGVDPVKINLEDQSVISGDRFCISVTGEGFDSIIGAGFRIEWDSTRLKFEEVIDSKTLPGLDVINNFNAFSSFLNFSWVHPNIFQGVTLNDNEELFKVCFTATFPCVSFPFLTEVKISENSTREIIPNNLNNSLGLLTKNSNVTYLRCPSFGLKFKSECPKDPVDLRDTVCIPIKTGDNFQNITRLGYRHNWNPRIMEFIKVDNIHPSLKDFTYEAANTIGGILGIKANPSSDLPENTLLYDVCFEINGLGSNSFFNFSNSNVDILKGNNPIGINAETCIIEVNQPDKLLIFAENNQGFQDSIVCIDYTVKNFNNLTEIKFDLIWEPNFLSELTIKDFLTGMDFILINDQLTVDWKSASSLSLPDGEKLFSLCYKLIGSPGLCESIELSNLFMPLVLASTSGTSNIGLIAQNPEICIMNPPGFVIQLDKFETFPSDTLCVPIKVKDFTNINGTSFDIKWDPNVLRFNSVKNLGFLSGDSILSQSIAVGILSYAWDSPTPFDIKDTTLLEVCFTTSRDAINTCTKISINNPAVSTIFGPGSINSNEGEVCVKDKFIIKSLKTFPVSCPNKADGSAELEFDGGSSNAQVSWINPNTGQVIDFGLNPKKLIQGKVLLSIFDGSTPTFRDTIEILLTNEIPLADAGLDTLYRCGGSFELNGMGSPGPDYQYKWSAITGRITGSSTNLKVGITEGGEYVLTVTKLSTGCSVSDTVIVQSPEYPKIEIEGGKEKYLTCLDSLIDLNVVPSPSNSILIWNGTNLLPGPLNSRIRQVNKSGKIILTIFNQTNSCSILDTISIIDQTAPPIAKAGEDVILPCGFSFLLKGDSSQSSFGYPLSFHWSSLSKDTQSMGSNFSVSKTGTYILEVTDEVTGCVASDTVLVKPDSLDPQIEFNVDNFELNCKNETFTLEAKVLKDSNYTFAWSTSNPSGFANPSGTSLNRTIIAPGIYTLNVDIDNSPCSLTQSIEVTENFNPPVARISSSADTITCNNPEIILSIIDFTPDTFYLIEWFKDGQKVASDSLKFHIQKGGNYEFVITDTLNGCTIKESKVILENLNVLPPPFTLLLSASGDGILDCERTSLDLSVFNLPISQSDFSIKWETDTGNITSIPDFFTVRINKPGTYKAILTNQKNGCSVQKEKLVTTNALLPTAIASVDGKITCAIPKRQLNSVGSSFGPNFSFTWKNQISGTNVSSEVVTDVSEPGPYILNILNTENSCSASDTIEVEIDTAAPKLIIQEPEILTCEKDTLVLNATGTDFNPEYTYSWSGLDNQTVITANNPLLVQIVAGGNYQLSVKNNQNGCTGIQKIEVEVDQDFPQANPGPQKILECKGSPISLDGSGSSVGDNFSYSWSAISGGSMLSNPSIPSPQVTQPGIYKLVVTNTQTGCSSEATVSVILNPELVLAIATGPADIICESEATIMGNLPSGTTGLWRKITQDPILSSPELATTSVSALVPGNNLFEWSLSVPNCSNYSMDTVNVEVAKAPIASDDALQLTNGLTMATINVLANDLISGQEYSVSLLKSPDVGKVAAIETGSPQYSVRGGYFGEDFFTYLLCNELCENLCDTATVFIDIPFDEDYKAPPLPNAITPNGDGLNDFLEFELLEDSGTIYPDNELIIFNRWGDIVFRARPYNNDWSGRGNDGKELPHATYYYVLRLNISEGIILKGDVTILQR